MPTPFEIDKMAQNIFNDSLPPKWLIRKQDPDIHIDYFVEIREKASPSGMIFGVQLKGTNSPRYSKSMIKISIKTQHLSYYLDKVKQPIFLIVVDVKKRRGFWFFVQRWGKEDLNDLNWRAQRKIDIKIPLTNCISEVEFFREEIEKAEVYMREVWPSSIQAAIKHETKLLEELDHRFHVDISYHGGITEYNLQIREPFNFDIQFMMSPHVQDKFSDFFDRAQPVIFDADEIIEVKGSPLLQSIFKRSEKGKLVLEPARKVQTVLLMSAVDAAEQEKIVLYGVEGILWVGEKEARFEGSLKETPLKVDFSLPLPLSGSNPLKINFLFESSTWGNLPVLRLPHFEKLKEFFTSINEGCLFKIVCEIKGNHLFTVKSKDKIDHTFMKTTFRHLQLIERIRTIAKEMNVDPIYPQKGAFSKDELDDIYLLSELIRFGEYRQNANEVKLILKLMLNDDFFEMIENENKSTSSGPIVFDQKDQKFTLLGKEFEFHPLRYTLTNSILMTDLSNITRDDAKVNEEGIDVQWSGGPESELIISKVHLTEI